jgi:putative hydrolase of the HAD superfamily
MSNAVERAGRTGFDRVDSWIFDLDNTLYPAHCDLFSQVSQRMGEFISAFLRVDRDEAHRIQKAYFHEFGTTMNGLMTRHAMAPQAFLDYVHDIDLEPLAPDAALDLALAGLEGRKYVFTNGSVRHAQNVLGRIGIAHHFDDIFDIVAADYVPKPRPECYDRFLARVAIAPGQSAMFEDIAHNLAHPHALGMVTVLVRSPRDRRADHSNEWDGIGADEPHVHHVTDNLAEFLAPLAARR